MKEQIKYLETMLERDTKMTLESEANYRALRSMAFTHKDQQIFAAETKAKDTRDANLTKVNHIKELIQEIKDGKYII